MNFVNRHIADRVSDTSGLGSDLSAAGTRTWPVRYESIEFVALCADAVTILFTSILSALLYKLHSGGASSELGKAFGCAIFASAFFISVIKANGLYRLTELLVLRSQIRAVWMAWISL